LEVTLHGFDGDQESLTQTQRLAGGAFAFEGIEPALGRVYVVTADYQEVLYASEIGELRDTPELELLHSLRVRQRQRHEISRLHLLFDFQPVVQVELRPRTSATALSTAARPALAALPGARLSLDGRTIATV
jgi:hypothetical protein